MRVRSRYSSVIIGRWGLPWNLLSEQRAQSRRELSDVQWTILLTASVAELFMAMAILRDQEAPPPRTFTRLGCYDLNLLDTA